jgi:hypothetical protein
MSPKEKARELVDKFSNEILLTINGGKVAALIAVDEILKSIGVVDWDGDDEEEEDNGYYDGVDFTNFFQYWLEVKQEIEKL